MVYDDVSKMIEENKESSNPISPEKMEEAMSDFAKSIDEAELGDSWVKRYHDLPAYKLDVRRDDSEAFAQALTEAIMAITKGEYGSIDYNGYRIYYSDEPQIASISLESGKKEYDFWIRFLCDALSCFSMAEYHSEEERKAFLDPNSKSFETTLGLLYEVIENLDAGKWIKGRKKLDIYDFKDYTSKELIFKNIEWDERNKRAACIFSYLMEEAIMRAKGTEFTEIDFKIFSSIIRRMVFFADYGKRSSFGLVDLQGLIWYRWKPKTKRDRYIWQCMDEFGQGDLPDNLLDRCTLYYFLYDPQGWEALACVVPIMVLWEMCNGYEPDDVKNKMFEMFSITPGKSRLKEIEKLIEEDRKKQAKEINADDQEDI